MGTESLQRMFTCLSVLTVARETIPVELWKPAGEEGLLYWMNKYHQYLRRSCKWASIKNLTASLCRITSRSGPFAEGLNMLC